MIDQITNRVKKIIVFKSEVTPSLYNQLFITEAEKLNISIKEIGGLCRVADEFHDHCENLEAIADNALEAINNNDVESLSAVKVQISKLKKEVSKLKNIAYEDALCKTFNRQYLYDQILSENKFTEDGIIVIADINNLKYINDNIGHVAGDKVIAKISKKLLSLTPETVRYGGDEFLLFFKNTHFIEKVNIKILEIRNKLTKSNYTFKEHSFKIDFAYTPIKYSAGI